MNIRPATKDDVQFLKKMLYEAARWNPDWPREPIEEVLADPVLVRYHQGWGRDGDGVAEVHHGLVERLEAPSSVLSDEPGGAAGRPPGDRADARLVILMSDALTETDVTAGRAIGGYASREGTRCTTSASAAGSPSRKDGLRMPSARAAMNRASSSRDA